jgi:hypothetical protein
MQSIDGVLPAAFAALMNSRCKSYEELREIFRVLLPLLPRLVYDSHLFESILYGLFGLITRTCGLVASASENDVDRERECLQACAASLSYARSIFPVSMKVDAAIKAATSGLPLDVRTYFS